jgi:hypothetical protein
VTLATGKVGRGENGAAAAVFQVYGHNFAKVLEPPLGAEVSMLWLVLASLVLFARAARPVAAGRHRGPGRFSPTPETGERSLATNHVGR